MNELKPAQVIDIILPDFEGEVDYNLIAAKFGSVDSITFHFTSQNEELMQILSMGFKGESKGLNPKTVEGIKYEVRAQLKDHAAQKVKTKVEWIWFDYLGTMRMRANYL